MSHEKFDLQRTTEEYMRMIEESKVLHSKVEEFHRDTAQRRKAHAEALQGTTATLIGLKNK